jgi:hypothetical protein
MVSGYDLDLCVDREIQVAVVLRLAYAVIQLIRSEVRSETLHLFLVMMVESDRYMSREWGM